MEFKLNDYNRNTSDQDLLDDLKRVADKLDKNVLTVTGENIHFDILAWSKGGETLLENLQVLCAEHNLAKGNVEY